MLKSCPYCSRIHPFGYACPRKPVHQRIQGGKRKDDGQQEIRSSSRWTKTSLRIRERDKFMCQLCFRGIKTLDGKKAITYDDVSVHHIVPLVEDKSQAFEGLNLLTLCRYHHDMAEEGKVSRAVLVQIAEEQEQKEALQNCQTTYPPSEGLF